ncbi:hypothetical protein BRC86_11365 [Halobacteriales archaeon QS_3_64_16]|jgi:hypothetical protein|nr:MAG: hypothetical protein BRC86_11365 [Halobacteriales archaeon QS_3_64_16]
MSGFDLDLGVVEQQMDEDEDADAEGRVVLGVLDGTTPPAEWVGTIEDGSVLVLSIEGDLNELAAEFARDIKELGGGLMHFRSFLILTPPGIAIDTDRL